MGSVISLPTFTDDEHNLLLDRQRKHIRWLIDNGIRAGSGVLMVAGGYGESYFLEDDEFEALVDVLADEAGGEVPTMVGVFELSARRAARKARYAADAGIDFVELGMPHYSLPSEEDIFLHHRYVNDNADIGIMTYNNYWVMPGTREISRGLLERYVELDNMVGVKWISGNEAHYVGMVRLFGDELNFIDNRMVMATGARHGMKGFVDFFGNVAPRLSLRLWELMREGRYDELDELLMTVHFDPNDDADDGGRAGLRRDGRRSSGQAAVEHSGPGDGTAVPRPGHALEGVRGPHAEDPGGARRSEGMDRLGPVHPGVDGFQRRGRLARGGGNKCD